MQAVAITKRKKVRVLDSKQIIEIIGQVIGIIAMAFNIYSFQFKTSNKVIVCQLFGGLLFSTSFFMLGSVTGGLLNAVAVLRAVVYRFEEKFHAKHIGWLIFFIALFVGSYVMTFTVFDTAFKFPHIVIELLPVVGMTASTISFRLQNAKAIRRYGLICSPSWLIYNIIGGAIGATICEILSLCSIFIGMWRHDFKKKAK